MRWQSRRSDKSNRCKCNRTDAIPETQSYPDLTAPRADQSAPPIPADARTLFLQLRQRYAQSPAFAKSAEAWDAVEKAIVAITPVPTNATARIAVLHDLKDRFVSAVKLAPLDDFGSPFGHAQITMKERIIAALEGVSV